MGRGDVRGIYVLTPSKPQAAPRLKKTFGAHAARRGGSDPDSPNLTNSDVRNR
jgi:hypothetical protein